jgi:hypothetical protein
LILEKEGREGGREKGREKVREEEREEERTHPSPHSPLPPLTPPSTHPSLPLLPSLEKKYTMCSQFLLGVFAAQKEKAGEEY